MSTSELIIQYFHPEMPECPPPVSDDDLKVMSLQARGEILARLAAVDHNCTVCDRGSNANRYLYVFIDGEHIVDDKGTTICEVKELEEALRVKCGKIIMRN